jgi:hypothetical protein
MNKRFKVQHASLHSMWATLNQLTGARAPVPTGVRVRKPRHTGLLTHAEVMVQLSHQPSQLSDPHFDLTSLNGLYRHFRHRIQPVSPGAMLAW